MRLVILGGGGFRVPLVYRAAVRRAGLGIDEIVLYDTDLDRLRVIAAVLEPTPGLLLRTTDSLPDALIGADLVFSAIRVGGAAGRVRDERRAIALGLLGQETVGAGGLAFGLRTLPVALEAARLQAELAPQAWLINFTNPAGLITQALTAVLGERVVGICDSPIGLVRRTAAALDLPIGAVQYDYAGINHLGWLTSMRRDGEELLPRFLLDESRRRRTEEGRLFDPELLRALGAVPNEYLYFYYAAREITAALAGSATRGEVLLAEQQDFYARAEADPGRAGRWWEQTRRHREQTYLAEARTEERDEQDLTGGGYEHVALDIAEAITAGRPAELILNARNGSALPQLPPEMIVETRCLVTGAGVTAQRGPVLSLHQLGLIASVRASEQAVIDAVVHRDRAAAVHGFAIHPLIGSRDLAERLLTSLVADEPSVGALLG